MWWLLRTVFFVFLGAVVPIGIADAAIVLLAGILAVDWDELAYTGDPAGAGGGWAIIGLICAGAALFCHGGAIAAVLVMIPSFIALALPRGSREASMDGSSRERTEESHRAMMERIRASNAGRADP